MWRVRPPYHPGGTNRRHVPADRQTSQRLVAGQPRSAPRINSAKRTGERQPHASGSASRQLEVGVVPTLYQSYPSVQMPRSIRILTWILVAALGAAAFAVLAFSRGETVSAAWVL